MRRAGLQQPDQVHRATDGQENRTQWRDQEIEQGSSTPLLGFPIADLDERAVYEVPGDRIMPALTSDFQAVLIVGMHAKSGKPRAFLERTVEPVPTAERPNACDDGFVSSSDLSSLRGEFVCLLPTTHSHVARLTEILTHPEVLNWWGEWDADRVRRELVAPDDGTVAFAIESAGEIVGFIQYAEETHPQYRHDSMDIALHPAWHHRGLGADATRVLARHLFTDRGHHRLTIDPAAHNERAIRSYRRVGFRPVGIMRRYELGPDGVWHDGLRLAGKTEDDILQFYGVAELEGLTPYPRPTVQPRSGRMAPLPPQMTGSNLTRTSL